MRARRGRNGPPLGNLMLGAFGIVADGRKHPLGVVDGATENTATDQALLDNLIDCGLDQVHKAHSITERIDPSPRGCAPNPPITPDRAPAAAFELHPVNNAE